MWQRLTVGLGPTALGSYVPWGLWVSFYDYLVWLEVGSLLVFTSLVYLAGFKQLTTLKPVVLFTGLAVLIIALFIVFLDLGQSWRFWHVLVYADFSSMITWMVWLHTLYLLVLLAELALALRLVRVAEATAEKFLKWLAYLSLPMGLGLILVSDSVFGVVAAALSVVTFIAVTLNVVIPVLAMPELKGLANVFVHDKLSYGYVPNQTVLQVTQLAPGAD